MTPMPAFRWRIAAMLLAALFALVACWVEVAGSLPGDDRALDRLTSAIGTSWDDTMVAIGAATDSVVVLVVAVLVASTLAWRGRRRDALYVALAVAVAVVLNPILKELFARPRPAVRPSPESVSTNAFPSGHASATASLVGGLLLVVPASRWRLTAVLGTLVLVIVAFSRIAIGVHYPSDILAGWLWVSAWVACLASTRAW